MARRKRKKGHARRGKALRRRYGRSSLPGGGSIRMNVTGQLVLDPETLQTVIETAVEQAVEVAVEESVPEAVEEGAAEALSAFDPADMEAANAYGGY